MKNEVLSELLTRMGHLLEIKGENPFKIKAYFRAADNIRALTEDISALADQDRLSEIPGVGKTLEEKIHQWIETGRIEAYEKLTQDYPESLLEIMHVPSVGPKKTKLFYDELKVTTLDQLSEAVQNGRLLNLAGIQEKTLANIRQGLIQARAGKSRMTLAAARTQAEEIIEAVRKTGKIHRIEFAGSLRRGKETVGDIDLLVDAKDPEKVMKAFVEMTSVQKVQAHGKTKSSIVTDRDTQVDLRIVPSEAFGAALLYFTGSKNFNIRLRQIAIEQGKKISEYGVFQLDGDEEHLITGESENSCFDALGLPYCPPELREDIGEAQYFQNRKIPSLITEKDLRGDLHTHSTWSDGRHSIEEMALAARTKGYDFLAVTDHSQKLRVANGLSKEDLNKKREEIDRLNKQMSPFRILCGSEVEIDRSGGLDYDDEILAGLDLVIAAVHSHFDLSEEEQTERLVKAVSHPQVNILAHPFGVHLGKRGPYKMDFEKVCRAAVKNHVALEINAFPIRLDLNGERVYFASKLGAVFTVNTDAHHRDHLGHMNLGITTARRGWLQAGKVINTYSLKKLQSFLAGKL